MRAACALAPPHPDRTIATRQRPGQTRAGGLGVLLAVLSFGLVGAGCFPKGAPAPPALSANSVTAASARWPGVTAASLAAGREHFVAKCNGCHAYPDLTSISNDEWPSIVERMAKKAHLGDQQRDEVLHFILASRQEQVGR